jgi:hypothetical protein
MALPQAHLEIIMHTTTHCDLNSRPEPEGTLVKIAMSKM